MRVLRSTIFVTMGTRPLTTVVRDIDVIDTLESIAIGLRQPGVLVVHDIFDIEDGTSIQTATYKAMRRIDKQLEQNMAVLFFWTLRQFALLNAGGTIMMDKRAPLMVEDIKYVFDALSREPTYQDYKIVAFAEDGTMVRLTDGAVVV